MTEYKNNLIEIAMNFINSNRISKFLDPDYSFELVDKKHTKHIKHITPPKIFPILCIF